MYEYDFHTYSIRKKSNKKKIVFWMFLVSLIGVIIVWNIFHKHQEKSETLGDSVVAEFAKAIVPKTNTNPLGQLVMNSLSDTQGAYAVVIINNKTGEKYTYNDHTEFDSASLYKLWIMAVVMQQLQAGKLHEDDPLEGDVAELNKKFDIASDSAELTEGSIDFTVQSALTQMITISHNYAALLLTEKVGLSTVQKFLDQNGFHESRVGIDNSLPTTTASDVALFFQKLMDGKLANPEYTDKMIALLKAQKLNSKLPRYLPSGTVIAHKTGELDLFSHDAGIVYLPDGSSYLIVVMTKSNNPSTAVDHISELSKDVYEYFTH